MISSSLKNKLLLLISFSLGVADESWKIYDDSEIAIINISMSADGLEWMYENPWSDSMHVASIEFQNAYINETIDSVAFIVPLTSSFSVGFVGAIPTFPFDLMRATSEEPVPSLTV